MLQLQGKSQSTNFKQKRRSEMFTDLHEDEVDPNIS